MGSNSFLERLCGRWNLLVELHFSHPRGLLLSRLLYNWRGGRRVSGKLHLCLLIKKDKITSLQRMSGGQWSPPKRKLKGVKKFKWKKHEALVNHCCQSLWRSNKFLEKLPLKIPKKKSKKRCSMLNQWHNLLQSLFSWTKWLSHSIKVTSFLFLRYLVVGIGWWLSFVDLFILRQGGLFG